MKSKVPSVFGESFQYHDIRQQENSQMASSRWEMLDAVDRHMRSVRQRQKPSYPPANNVETTYRASEVSRSGNGNNGSTNKQFNMEINRR